MNILTGIVPGEIMRGDDPDVDDAPDESLTTVQTTNSEEHRQE